MTEEIAAWLLGRLPDDWFTGPAAVTVDRDEVIVIGELAAPDLAVPDVAEPAEAAEPARREAAAGRIGRFRGDTRAQRMAIAREAQERFGRKVGWGARCDGVLERFTTLSVPVMTRLRQPERLVLDTLVDAGVARSRSHALAWCVRLVGEHEQEWLAELRTALEAVERVRSAHPGAA